MWKVGEAGFLMPHTVIIGGSHAGVAAAAELRARDAGMEITLICEEQQLPYQRPPLSKAYLKGELAEERLFLKAAEYFAAADIELVTGARVAAIDPAARALTLADGKTFSYSKLLLATGTRARTLPLPGGDLALCVAAQHLKKLEERPDAKVMTALGEAWRPHRSAAARFLWHLYRHPGVALGRGVKKTA